MRDDVEGDLLGEFVRLGGIADEEDAVGSERAAMFGISEGVPMSVVFAASRLTPKFDASSTFQRSHDAKAVS